MRYWRVGLGLALGLSWLAQPVLARPDRLHPRQPVSNHSEPAFGFADNYTGPFLDALLAETKAGGGDTVRFGVSWAAAQPDPLLGYNFTDSDAAYEKAVGLGLRPVIVLTSAPCWAHPSVACDGTYNSVRPDNAFLREWTAFASAVATRYPAARGFEIWNEPNLAGFWGTDPSPRSYVRLLRASAAGIRQTRSQVPVVFGGPAPVATAAGYLQHAYRRGAAKYSDKLAIHVYPIRHPVVQNVLDQARRAITIQRRYDPTGALWVTEAGVSTAPDPYWQPRVNPRYQSQDLVKIYQGLRDQGVKLIIVFRLRDPVAGLFPPQSWQTGLGVEYSNGRPKLAYCALANERGQPIPPPC
jgi:hypothetical protein